MPPTGAGPFRVTVPLVDVPPMTDVGDTDSEEGIGGETVILAFSEAKASVAVN